MSNCSCDFCYRGYRNYINDPCQYCGKIINPIHNSRNAGPAPAPGWLKGDKDENPIVWSHGSCYSQNNPTANYMKYQSGRQYDLKPSELPNPARELHNKQQFDREKIKRGYDLELAELSDKFQESNMSIQLLSLIRGLPEEDPCHQLVSSFLETHSDKTCSICYTSLISWPPRESLIITECRLPHIFHARCLQSWMLTKENPSCPICRSDINRRSLNVIDMPTTLDQPAVCRLIGRLTRLFENKPQSTE